MKNYLQNKFITKNQEETEKLGEKFAKKIKPGEAVFLSGELGSGKTHFAKGIARQLGIKRRIISPTFTLVRNYKYGDLNFFHIDLYRIKDASDIRNLGLEDFFGQSNSITVIEWPEKIKDIIPDWLVEFKYLSQNTREITVSQNKIGRDLNKAAEILQNGGIVIFPTDTAFGIGCKINDAKAIKKLFKIRKRPENKATPILVSSLEMAKKCLKNLPPDVEKLMKKYWPGGLTIVFKAKDKRIDPLVRGNGENLGVRMPDNQNLLSIIAKVGVPILGPSANFSGEKTPFKLKDLDSRLISLADYVLKGEAKGKKASTVIDCTIKPWRIIRQGEVQL